MQLVPIPIQSGRGSQRPVARAQVLSQVKFMGLPFEVEPEPAPWAPISRFLSRVIGRLVAARP